MILNWNGAGHLRRFLPSVLASVPEGVGVVVADNGSTDDSLGVLEREFPAVGRIVLDRNYGFAGGYNRALEYLDADYFILLNSDVETPAGWVEPLVETAHRPKYFGPAAESAPLAQKTSRASTYCPSSRSTHCKIDLGRKDTPGSR